MKIIGIIAEYNPFHNGHAYQIEKIKKDYDADYVVIAMSGDFVQRGAPAIIDKYARAKMALSCGADLVIELPTLWATASAEHFAMAGVTLFEKMGCLNGLCFGAETDNLPLLSAIADVLAKEPDAYRDTLSSYIKSGLNFPTARAMALTDLFGTPHAIALPASLSTDCDELSSILNSPNNILAIEYLKSLKRRSSGLTPFLIKREGAGYHETDFSATQAASATGIRAALMKTQNNQNCIASSEIEFKLSVAMPAAAYSILQEYLCENPLLSTDDFSSVLGYRLLSMSLAELSSIGDCNIDIANRLTKNLSSFSSFSSFSEENKSRDITYTRMSRLLLHTVLSITNDDYSYFSDMDYIPYLRILGFRKDATALLKRLKADTSVPLISKLADASSILAANALQLLEKDIFAANVYEQIKAVKQFSGSPTTQKKTTPRNEYTREIVRI